MPEVGVLNLSIRDNSKEAGRGLDQLADALTRVKTAVNSGFDLSPVAKQITSLTTIVSSTKGASTVVKNLGTLFNAITNFSKIKSFNIPTQPFEDLKKAIGDGFKIGTAGTQINALRQAMEGKWGDGTGVQVMKDLHGVVKKFGDGGDANKLRDLSSALDQYTESLKKMNEISQAAGDWRMAMGSSSSEQVPQIGKYGKAGLTQFGRKAKIATSSEQLKMDLDAIIKDTEGEFERVESAIVKCKDAMQGFNIMAKMVKTTSTEVADNITTNISNDLNKYISSPVQSLMERFRDCEGAMQAFGDKFSAVLPKINEAGIQATISSKHIEALVSRLNTEIKWKGMNQLVDQLTGVRKNFLDAEESAKTFQKYSDEVFRVEQALDAAAMAETEMAAAAARSNNVLIELVEIGDRITSVRTDSIGDKINEAFDSTNAKERMQEFIEYLKEMYNYATRPVGRGTWADIAGEVEQANSSAETFYHTVERTNELVQNMKWNFQEMWRTFQRMFFEMSDFFSSRALGSGIAGFIGPGTAGSTLSTDVENGWTYWKEGAIEVEGTVSEVVDDVKRLTSPETLKLGSGQTVFSSLEEAAKALGISVEEARQRCADTFAFIQNSSSAASGSGMTVFSSIEEAARAMGITVEEAREKCQETMIMLGMTTNQIQNSLDDTVTAINNAKTAGAVGDSFIPLDQFLKTYSHLDYLKSKLSDLENSFVTNHNLGLLNPTEIDENVSKIIKLREEIAKLEREEEQASSVTYRLKTAFNNFKEGIGKVFPTLTGLLKRFGQIAKYRMLRAILKHIAEGFSAGVENVYYYSKAVGTDLAPAMDSAATSFLQLKNSIGAAVAPLIQAFIPVINQVVSVVIDAINYLNQFFALLNGQKQWTRALPATTTAFNKQEKAAKGAANAVKDLLADWDELNIIQSETSGAGSGTGKTAEDYLSMFEEVDKFDDSVRGVIDFIRDNFDTIKQAAIGIGAAILGWKVSNAFSGFIGVFGNLLAQAATVYVTLKLTDAFGKEFVKTGEPGWFIADALTGAIGATLAGSLAAKLAGGAWGEITAGFTLILAGTVNLKNSRSAFAQEKTTEGQMLALLGSVETGIGAALIAAGFTASAPVALAVGAAAAVYSYAVNALAAVNITGIKWGTNTLSEQEVRDFVQKEMLSVDIDAQIKITRASIELVEEEERKLTEEATALLKPVNALKLGVNVDESLEQIKKSVFGDDGLIAQFKKYSSSQRDLVNTAETFVPTLDSEGNDISGQIMQDSTNAWTELNGLMDDLGADLSLHLTKAMDKTLSEELRKFEMNAVSEITDTMIRVSLAGKRATVGSDALTDLKFDLANASEGTFKDILTVYGEYEDKLRKENQDIKKAEASSFASAAAQYEVYAEDALRKAGGDTTDKIYQEYISKAEYYAGRYTEIMDSLSDSVEASVNEAVEPGRVLLKKAIADLLKNAKELRDGRVELFTDGKIKGLPTGAAGRLKENTEFALQNLMFGGMNEGITDENAEKLEGLYKEWLSAIIKDFMPDDYSTIQELIDRKIIDYSDIFDPEVLFENMASVQGYNTDFYRQMWDRLYGTNMQNKFGTIAEDVVKGMQDVVNKTSFDKIEFPIEADPEVTIDDSELQKAIEDALEDKKITWREENEIIEKFGMKQYEDILERLNLDYDEFGNVIQGKGTNPFGMIAAGGMSDMGMGRPNMLGTPEDTTAIAKSQEQQTNRFFGASGKVMVEGSDVSNGVKDGTAAGFQTLSAKLDMLSKLDTTNQLLRQIARAGTPNNNQGTMASLGFGLMQGLNAVDKVIG